MSDLMLFKEMSSMATVMHKSGFFKDVKSEAQALVKIQAGQEIGVPPFAAMNGINIIQGKAEVGSGLIASLIDSHPNYDYSVKKSDSEECIIEFFKGGKSKGVCSFSIEDAKKAGLAGKDNWKKYTKDMLFARCISRAKKYIPGFLNGVVVYSEGEIQEAQEPTVYAKSEVVDKETGEVKEVHTIKSRVNAVTSTNEVDKFVKRLAEKTPYFLNPDDTPNEFRMKGAICKMVSNKDDVAEFEPIKEMIVEFAPEIVDLTARNMVWPGTSHVDYWKALDRALAFYADWKKKVEEEENKDLPFAQTDEEKEGELK